MHGFLIFDPVEPRTDFCLRSGVDGILWIQPVTGRTDIACRALGSDDFDCLSAFQWRRERYHDAIDPCAPATMTDVTVNLIGKINRCRSLRQIDHSRLWSQHINPVIECRCLDLFNPFLMSVVFIDNDIIHFCLP